MTRCRLLLLYPLLGLLVACTDSAEAPTTESDSNVETGDAATQSDASPPTVDEPAVDDMSGDPDGSTVGEPPVDDTSGDPDGSSGEFFICNYTNDFSGNRECRIFTGAAWTRSAAEELCVEPIPGSVGVLSMDPCPREGALGTCIKDVDKPEEQVIWFLEGDPATAKRACEQFAGGAWHSRLDVGAVQPRSELRPEARAAMRSTADVTVSPEAISDAALITIQDGAGHLAFTPKKGGTSTGIIFYPGGRVDPRSYAPAAHLFAKQGYFVAIQPMRGYLALGSDMMRADAVIEAHPEIAQWVIMGHSLGGTAAARYAHDTKHSLMALVILSSFNDKAHTLASSTLPAMTVIGTKEKIFLDSNRNNELHQAQAFLPPGAVIVEIEGGTHFGFTYSVPPNPEGGTISVAEQHAQYVERVHAFIQSSLPAP